MQVYVEELAGAALDWAVGQREGRDDRAAARFLGKRYYKPSSEWSDGGPIVEREVCTLIKRDGIWMAEVLDSRFCYSMRGPTALVAAMRAYVVARLGDCIEIPDELKDML